MANVCSKAMVMLSFLSFCMNGSQKSMANICSKAMVLLSPLSLLWWMGHRNLQLVLSYGIGYVVVTSHTSLMNGSQKSMTNVGSTVMVMFLAFLWLIGSQKCTATVRSKAIGLLLSLLLLLWWMGSQKSMTNVGSAAMYLLLSLLLYFDEWDHRNLWQMLVQQRWLCCWHFFINGITELYSYCLF